MITIEKYSDSRKVQTHQLSVTTEQSQFTVSNIAEFLGCLASHEHPQLILSDDQVVGFFILDTQYNNHYDFCPSEAIGIRGLLIDQRFQGQGFAVQAILAMPAYISKKYSTFSSIYLTVNCRNEPAYNCYLKCGFKDSGHLYYGGAAGPQHIMSYAITQ
ncbi:MAG: GNAT family N-acetyltransferase [Aliivibrio sp.]|uniref:GNAT family N-acetyltransferase n=1 Tax=Aliivibrio sp. TaxID=1872443 RepID=UPI001A40916D|nr:GNAT family N-acetyltransferase [Aliivibrio sp.]